MKCPVICMDFSFLVLALIQVSVSFKSVLAKAVMAQNSQIGASNWSMGMRSKVFDLQP